MGEKFTPQSIEGNKDRDSVYLPGVHENPRIKAKEETTELSDNDLEEVKEGEGEEELSDSDIIEEN